MKAKGLLSILSMLIICLASCQKSEEVIVGKSYTISYNGHNEYLIIHVFEYDDNGESIFDSENKIFRGRPKIFFAQPNAALVKLYTELSPENVGWVQTAYPLSNDGIGIAINDKTILGDEP
jgi:hypothetical protein